MEITALLNQFANDPLLLGGTIVVLGGALLYQKKSDSSLYEKINPESMKERLKKIFVDPTSTQGAKIGDTVKMRGTSNTPVTIGKAVKAKDHDVQIVKYGNDDDNSDVETEKVEGTTYKIIEGSNKFQIYPKYFPYKILGSLIENRVTETYDVPQRHVMPGDDYLWFSHKTHFVKFNGVKRVASVEGMSRIQETTFSKVHENYLEAQQAIPEQYATLNNRISGDIKLENIKSENIKEYMESKDKSKKKNAMKD